jgi:hypothetical protein
MHNMDDERVAGRVVVRVANELAEREPVAAAEWTDTMRGTKVFYKELTEGLVGSWSRQDPSVALNWTETLEPGLRRPALGRILGSMPRGNWLPLASLEIRNGPSDSTMNAARAAYAHPTMHETPESKAVGYRKAD